MRRLALILAFVLAAMSFDTAARETFVPKGDLSAGTQLAFINFSSDNSEYLLMLNPLSAEAKFKLFSPFFEYAYADNGSIGFRLDYSIITAAVDNLTLDLLNEGLSFGVDNLNAETKSAGASIFHRNYFAVDQKKRFGFFCEESFGYRSGRTEFHLGDPSDSYTKSSRVSLSFSPGFVFYVMNNVSVSCSVGMAGVSYNKVTCFNEGSATGDRQKFAVRFGPDLLGANFGIAFHF